jgi:hypothetical protein
MSKIKTVKATVTRRTLSGSSIPSVIDAGRIDSLDEAALRKTLSSQFSDPDLINRLVDARRGAFHKRYRKPLLNAKVSTKRIEDLAYAPMFQDS